MCLVVARYFESAESTESIVAQALLASLGVLTFSLLVSGISRTRNLLRRGLNDLHTRARSRTLFLDSAVRSDHIDAFLAGRAREHHRTGEAAVYVVSYGTAGPWSSVVLHFGLCIVFAGMIVNSLYSLEGVFSLTEGESVDVRGDRLRLVHTGALAGKIDEVSLRVNLAEFQKLYRVENTSTSSSLLAIQESGGWITQRVHVNTAIEARGYTIHQGTMWGYSPGLYIADSAGHVIFSGYMRIATILRDGNTRFADSTTLQDGTVLNIEFTPPATAGEYSGAAGVSNNTVPVISGFLSGNTFGRQLFHVALGKDTTISGITVAFPELRHWSQFGISRDPGLWIVVAGLVLCIAGITLRALVSYQRLVLIHDRQEGAAMIRLYFESEKPSEESDADVSAIVSALVSAAAVADPPLLLREADGGAHV